MIRIGPGIIADQDSFHARLRRTEAIANWITRKFEIQNPLPRKGGLTQFVYVKSWVFVYSIVRVYKIIANFDYLEDRWCQTFSAICRLVFQHPRTTHLDETESETTATTTNIYSKQVEKVLLSELILLKRRLCLFALRSLTINTLLYKSKEK